MIVQFLADENIHGKIVSFLRSTGLNVEWIKEVAPGSTDETILLRPDIRNQILISNDRDFGDLIFAKGFPAPKAILYTRMTHRNWELTSRRLIEVIKTGIAKGTIMTILERGERVRPFPNGASDD